MSSIHTLLFEKVIEIIYGPYDPLTITPEEQSVFTETFRERMSRWIQDKSYRKIIGPLQPSYIFSQINKVPVAVIESIVDELDLELPTEIDTSDFSLNEMSEQEATDLWDKIAAKEIQECDEDDENDLIDALVKVESDTYKKKMDNLPFEFVDLTQKTDEDAEVSSNVLSAINYLEGIIEKIKKGEMHAMTLIALLKDGQASLWIPGSFDENDVEALYDPIIEALKNSGPISNVN